MRIVQTFNAIFFLILALSFWQSGSSFNLARHGVNLAAPTIIFGLIYYIFLLIYLIIHYRYRRISVDAFNIFLFLFSVLIVPGVIATGPIDNSYLPHCIFLACGIVFISTGIIFELLSPGTLKRSFSVSFPDMLSNKTAMSYFIIYILLVVIVFASGNLNRASAFEIIIRLVFPTANEITSTIAQYRSDVYYSWGIREVIGNYAGAVFAPFFAVILFNHLFSRGKKDGNIIQILIAIAILLFPIIFAVGTGSRLTLLRTILFYLIFMI